MAGLFKKKENTINFCFFYLIKKTFDTVWHNFLLLKLQRAGINDNMYQLLKTRYNSLLSQIKCWNICTGPLIMTQGVHEGI